MWRSSHGLRRASDQSRPLQEALTPHAPQATLFDDDGIMVRFLNSRTEGSGLRTEADVSALLQNIKFTGSTPLGAALRNKVGRSVSRSEEKERERKG